MLSVRQRAVTAARRSRPTKFQNKRPYASEGHAKDTTPGAGEESFGTSFYMFVGALPAAGLVYSLSRPGKDGEPHALQRYIGRLGDLHKTWEERNTLHTEAVEQAARDRHLFLYAGKNEFVDLKYPEVFQHGSQINVPAGHGSHLDKVHAHYKQKAQEEEQRVARKLAAEASKTS